METYAWTATGWEVSFAVYGTRGALEYSDRNGRPVLTWVRRDEGNASWAEPEALAEDGGASDHTRAVAAFVAAVRGEGPVICTGDDGLEAVRLALACYESAGRNAPVALAPCATG